MKWKQIRIKTVPEAEDVLISALADIGIEGVQIEDNQPLSEQDQAQMFVDIMPPEPVDNGIAYLTCYVEENTDMPALVGRIEAVLEETRAFMEIGEGEISLSETEDKDWINNWKEYFHQFSVGDFLIVPSWEEVSREDQGKKILHIDPGTAFGTGMHETTQLVIRQLQKHVRPGMEMLDLGTGSGILGLVALKLGAVHVLGTDLDPCTIPAVKDNRLANGVEEEQLSLCIGNLAEDAALQEKVCREEYDLVTANILADVLTALTPHVPACLKKGGYYITSGILDVKESLVIEAIERAGLSVQEITSQGEWVCITARKD